MKLMNKSIIQSILLSIILIFNCCNSRHTAKENMPETGMQLKEENSVLVIIWSSADKDVALKTALSYALNSKLNGWIQNVTVLAWGPSVQLLAKDKDIQNVFTYMKQAGVTILVDKKCAEENNVTKEIEALHLDVIGMGKLLSEYIKQKRTILTF